MSLYGHFLDILFEKRNSHLPVVCDGMVTDPVLYSLSFCHHFLNNLLFTVTSIIFCHHSCLSLFPYWLLGNILLQVYYFLFIQGGFHFLTQTGDKHKRASDYQKQVAFHYSHMYPVSIFSQHYCFCLIAPGVHFFSQLIIG